jgi:hypothetical protein
MPKTEKVQKPQTKEIKVAVKTDLEIAIDLSKELQQGIFLVKTINENIATYLKLIDWEPRRQSSFKKRAITQLAVMEKAERFARFEIAELKK